MTDTMRILVVDDEIGMQKGVQRVLRDFTVQLPDVQAEVQFELATAGSGLAALASIDEHPPQILLLDLKLPDMSGLEILRRVAAKGAETLTIMITAYASLETAVEATKRGAYDFLAKPFTPEELRNVIHKAAQRLIFERQARRLAEEKHQVRFQFISVLAHELKAPLSAIDGYLQILRDRSAGDDPAVYARMLDRSLIRLEAMRKLIGDLLDLTRIESGLKTREMATVDVREVARAAVETVLGEAKKRNIAVELHAEAPAEMQADRGEIEIILNNLLSNAVKYNRDGGRVDATIRAGERTVTIRVADTGIGMTAEESARLFRDFTRIKNEKTRNILGSGLGLSIVKKLTQLYDGNAAVASQTDVGSTFTVTLGRSARGAKQDDET